MQRTLKVDIRTDFKDISEKTPRISDVDSKGLKRGFLKKRISDVDSKGLK